jgi:hypothetical protein
MNDEQYNELFGSIQGLSDILLTLVVTLDKQRVINAEDFAADLSKLSVIRSLEPHLDSARYQLAFLADRIEDYKHQKVSSEIEQ